MTAIDKRATPSVLISAAALVIIVAGLQAAASFFLPFLIALFLALLSFPLLESLLRRRVRLSVAVGLTFLADLAVMLVFALVVTRAVARFTRAAPDYWDLLVEKFRAWSAALAERNIVLSELIDFDTISATDLTDVVTGILGGTVKGVASVLSFTVLVLLTMVCFLYEAVGFPEKIRRAFEGGGYRSAYFTKITGEIQRYLGIKTALSLVTGVLVAVWVSLLGVDFPIFWGLVAFLLNYIPIIGSIVAAVPTALLTIAQHGLGRAALVVVGYLVINFLLGNLLEPLLMGRSFGLSTLVVFLALVFWGWVWGPLGMLLSVPLTIVLKIVLRHTESLRWIAVLMSPGGQLDEALVEQT